MSKYVSVLCITAGIVISTLASAKEVRVRVLLPSARNKENVVPSGFQATRRTELLFCFVKHLLLYVTFSCTDNPRKQTIVKKKL